MSKDSEARSTRGASVERAYTEIRQRAMTFALRPGERINELQLAKELNVSRTPLREALNRLTAEDLLTFSVNRGFSCRELDAKEIFDLYELREELEVGIVRRVAERASRAELEEVLDFLHETAELSDPTDLDRMVALDMKFHEWMADLSRNRQMLETLKSINTRIYFVRWVDMTDTRRDVTQGEHRQVVQHLLDGEAEAAEAVMRQHITRRMDQIVEMLKRGYAYIYVTQAMNGPANHG
ncbi:GntR family transcriptional regulator [Fodinicurvata fenggangensis]|uniref:GntR family transcriptional regulator n=1 Tax=Fodinicurvata fenggangensis TaxID=1121830 RepID=UPI000689A086|nr:GntR family transcriptional regulator [Fodinicurvata fenggangensis]